MINRIESQADHEQEIYPVEPERVRLRDRIYRLMHGSVELTTNTSVATGRAIGYVAGQTVRGVKETVDGVRRGYNNESIHPKTETKKKAA